MKSGDRLPSLPDASRDAEDLGDLAAETADLLLGVPVVGFIRKLSKGSDDVSNYLLKRKLARFLAGLQDIPIEQIRSAIAKLDVDIEHRRHVGENLMLLLHKLDDIRKPEMLARAWRAYLGGQIDRVTLFQLNRAVDQIDVEDVPLLRDLYRGRTSPEGLPTYPITRPERSLIEEPDPEKPQENLVDDRTWDRLVRLATCGLLSMVLGRASAFSPVPGGLRVNDLGRIFVQIVVP